MRQIFLDHCATTPVAPSVREAMLPFLGEHFGDPASGHSLGRAAQEAVEDARGQVANLIGAEPDDIVFTSGGTEANNLAILGVLLRQSSATGGHLVVSSIEHASVGQSARFLERLGYDVTVVGVTGQGVVQPSAVKAAIRSDTRLVSITHASHEIGSIQPLRQIAAVCHDEQIPLHADGVQSAGKLRTRIDELEVDLFSLSAHKLHGPKGVGALYIRRGVDLVPIVRGDGREAGLRGGMENVPGIVGFGRAAYLAARSLDQSSERLAELRDRLWQLLLEGVGPDLVLHAALADRVPHLLSVGFPGVTGHDLLARIPEVCAATGSSSHGESEAVSPTLAALGLSAEQARGTVRLSVGWYTGPDEIERAASLLVAAWESLR